MFSRQPACFFRRQRSQIEVGRGRQSLVVRETSLQIPFPGLRHVSLAMRGAGLVERGDRGLAGVSAVELLAGRRELVPRLVEFALAIPAQSLANRLCRIVGPTDSGKRRDQNECRRDRQGGMTGSGAGPSRAVGAGLKFLLGRLDRTGVGTRERIGQQGQQRQREEDLELVRPTNPFAALLFAAAPALKVFRVQFSQIVGAGSHGDIDTGRLERDFLEERAVQLAPHLLPLVLDVRLAIPRPAGCARRDRRRPGRR